MGMISQFGPIRFNETAGGNYEVNSHAENSATLGLKSSFVQEFKDKAETIYFVDAISGVYGFSSVSQFNNSSGVNLRIDSCKFCVDSGKVVYTNLDGAVVGKRLVAKFDGVVDIEVRENTSVIHTFNSVSGQFDFILDQNFTNLTITFNSTSEYCIYGIMLCEPSAQFTLCGDAHTAPLIGISPFGGAYLISTATTGRMEEQTLWTNLLWTYVFDTSTITNYTTLGASTLNINFNNGFVINYPAATTLLEDFQNSYDWVLFQSLGGGLVQITLPYRIDSVDFYNDNLGTFEAAVIDSEGRQFVEDYYFITTGSGETYSGQMEVLFETNPGELVINLDDIDFNKVNAVSYSVVVGVTENNYFQCCVIELSEFDELTSEPLSVVAETDQRLIQYLDTQFRQGLFANFEHQLWLDCNLRRTAGSQTNSFVGEKRDYILKGRVSLNRELQTKNAIPDYLCEILEGALNCDSFKIDGVLYAKTDEPAFEYVDDNVLLCEFSAEIRKSE